MTAVDFVKRPINLDPISYRQCEELRQNSAISLSAAIRIAIRQAYVQMKKEQATNQV